MSETLTMAVCGDCTSFPLSFRDQERFCRSVMATVNFLTPACPRQAERRRSPCGDLVADKLAVARAHFRTISRRLGEAFQSVRDRHEAKELERQRIENERIAYEEYQAGLPDRLLNNEFRGVVYFVECGPFVKVGFTSTPVKRRLSGLMTANPFDLTLMGLVPGNMKLERHFHRKLREYHHRLEWFRLDERGRKRARRLIASNGGRVLEKRLTTRGAI